MGISDRRWNALADSMSLRQSKLISVSGGVEGGIFSSVESSVGFLTKSVRTSW